MRQIAAASLLLPGLALPRAPAQPFPPLGRAKIPPPRAARAPMTGAFRDQAGRAVTLAAVARGRPVVLVPIQYFCPNLCGLTLTGLAQPAQRQPDRRFTVVTLGIDPRETPAAAAKAVADLNTPV